MKAKCTFLIHISIKHNNCRSSVTPNAQESEDSGLGIGYSSADTSKRVSSSSSSISEQDHDDKNLYDDDDKVLRQKGSSKILINATGSGGHDFR